jgi:predicted RNase H-like nuclease
VRFVGLDLAWGTRRDSGLCVLDEAGTVLGSSRLRTDDDIADWIAPHLLGGSVVGVDAPVIVTNLTGRRRCEALLGSVFAHREAGAYPANRANPCFADGGRAFHLAARLDLATDPWFAVRSPARHIIEVYPHSALICLFELARTLKYKRGRGRTIADRLACFGQFCDLLASLGTAEPPMDLEGSADWARVRAELAAARTGADLDRVEDEIDAYVCAYVALYYWWWGSERCAVLGDAETGAVVTPVDGEARRRLAADDPGTSGKP